MSSLTTLVTKTPLPTQVEEVELKHSTQSHVREKGKTVRFKLYSTNMNKPKSNWKRRLAKSQHTMLNEDAKQKLQDYRRIQRAERKHERKKYKPSIVMDSAATSTVLRESDKKYVTVLNEISNKMYRNANGTTSKAGNKALLPYNLRGEAREADVVPSLAVNSLLSTCQLADENYITIFTKDEVKVFDAETTKLNIDGHIIMKGWRCPETKLWRVPLTEEMNNLNTDTAILSNEATDIILRKRENMDTTEFVNSVYELPNLEQVVAWYHAATGYPTKITWLAAINAGFFATWPLLTAKAVRKHFPESDEVAKGHMRRVKSGVRSTKAQVQEHPEIKEAEATLAQLRKKHNDVYVQVRLASEMTYTDQTGRFPVVGAGGYKYIMVLLELDGNYIAMEPTKSKETDELI